LTLSSLDEVYGCSEGVVTRVMDGGGTLRADELERIEREVVGFERDFPQAWLSVSAVSLGSAVALRLFGFWLLNRATLAGSGITRPNENGVVVLIDAEARAASISIGYQLEPWLPEDGMESILATGRREFRKGRTAEGVVCVVRALATALRASLQSPPQESVVVRSPLDGLRRLRSGGEPVRQPTDAESHEP